MSSPANDASAVGVDAAAAPSPGQRLQLDPSIEYLAVYGTLRDDDDSGAPWTRAFLAGKADACDGRVHGARMYWDVSKVNYPYVMLDKAQNEHAFQVRADGPAAAASSSPSTASTLSPQPFSALSPTPPLSSSSSPSPSPSSPSPSPSFSQVQVRLLRWPDRASWEAKMAEADAIEGFDPADERASEYVRRQVWVERVDGAERSWVRAYLYVLLESTQAAAHWVALEEGSWMKRQRDLWKPQTASEP